MSFIIDDDNDEDDEEEEDEDEDIVAILHVCESVQLNSNGDGCVGTER